MLCIACSSLLNRDFVSEEVPGTAKARQQVEVTKVKRLVLVMAHHDLGSKVVRHHL